MECYLIDKIKNMKNLPTNNQKWPCYRLFKQALTEQVVSDWICGHFVATKQSRRMYARTILRRGWVSQSFDHTSSTNTDFCGSIFETRRYGVEI